MGNTFGDIRIVVLGGEGFIGNAVANKLRENLNYTVIVPHRDRDLTDYNNVVSMTRNADWVFSFAADMGGVGYFSQQEYYPTINNFLIDLNVLRACEHNKVKKLFYPSSACAYNIDLMNKGKNLSENMIDLPANPDRMYGWEKLTMLKLMQHSPMDCRVGILHTVYGPGQEFSSQKTKFPPSIAYKAVKALKTHEIEVWGDGKQTRTFLYISDAVNKIIEIMEKKDYYGPVNVGSDKEVSIDEVVNVCLKELQISPKIKHLKDKPTGPKRRRCSNKKFNKFYKTREKVDIVEGFSSLISYILSRV